MKILFALLVTILLVSFTTPINTIEQPVEQIEQVSAESITIETWNYTCLDCGTIWQSNEEQTPPDCPQCSGGFIVSNHVDTLHDQTVIGGVTYTYVSYYYECWEKQIQF